MRARVRIQFGRDHFLVFALQAFLLVWGQELIRHVEKNVVFFLDMLCQKIRVRQREPQYRGQSSVITAPDKRD
jgi:hypothetical protein